MSNANGRQSEHYVPAVGGSIADDVLAMGPITSASDSSSPDNGNGNGMEIGNGNGAADDSPPPPITPDFFARAGRRRR